MSSSPPPTADAFQKSLANIREQIKEWPKQPGVYLMRDSSRRILYIGKAKVLRNRIKSYFASPDEIIGKNKLLVRRVAEVEFQVTNNELEALLLECNLIKQHRPRFNIRLKDDKNFPYVVLDFTQRFPQFRITRKVHFSPALKYFGPFGAGVREISRFLAKTFRIRDCSESKFKNRTRPCLNYEIGTCTAPCVGLVSEEEYSKQLREARLFLDGKKRDLLKELNAEMEEMSEKMEYERAKVARDKIHSIETLTQKQDAVDAGSVKDVDVIGRYDLDNEMQWVILFIRGGFLSGRRAIKTPIPIESREEVTQSFLEQFYTSNVPPHEVWVAEDFPGRETLEELVCMKLGRTIRFKVKRDERGMRLLGMAQENAKLVYQDAQKRLTVSATAQLKEVLGLSEEPHVIEGVDVSNTQGAQAVIALVQFVGEAPMKSQYRTYHPQTVVGQDDFAMIYELCKRRYGKEDAVFPDLLMIDGGKGQLAAAKRALDELELDFPVCSLAKSRTDSGFTRKEINKSEERIFLPERKNPILLNEGHPALRLLQQVRDEAHRFSVTMHRKRRDKHSKLSWLDDVPGVGPKTKDLLLKNYPSREDLSGATVDSLKAIGLTEKQAEAVLALADESSYNEDPDFNFNQAPPEDE